MGYKRRVTRLLAQAGDSNLDRKVTSMSAKDPIIDPSELTKSVYYDPETGVFIRRSSIGGARPGRVLGYVTEKGYLRLNVCGHHMRAHRLAWFYCYGRWPAGQLDHINQDKTDNRIANLREADHSLNAANRVKAANPNKWGYAGVQSVRCKGRFRYKAVITVWNELKHLGTFATPAEAGAAYQAARLRYFGDFAA
jgi:hypothetical protein